MRRIDADALIESIMTQFGGDPRYYTDKEAIMCAYAMDCINSAPTVEPIEWILCSKRLPEKYGEYLITTTYLGEPYVTTDEYFSYGWDDWGRDVIAWAERPKPWRGRKDEQTD